MARWPRRRVVGRAKHDAVQEVAYDLPLLLQVFLGDLERDDHVVDVALGVGLQAGAQVVADADVVDDEAAGLALEDAVDAGDRLIRPSSALRRHLHLAERLRCGLAEERALLSGIWPATRRDLTVVPWEHRTIDVPIALAVLAVLLASDPQDAQGEDGTGEHRRDLHGTYLACEIAEY